MFQNDKVVALSAQDGSSLWDFLPDSPFWNFFATTPGDGTVLFATYCGGAYRVRLDDGSLVWKSGYTDHRMWSTGGGTLGPNGMYYVETNHWGLEGGPGVVHAYRVSDGERVWQRTFGEYWGAQVPAVGRLGGAERPAEGLSVVAAIGQNPDMPYDAQWPFLVPKFLRIAYLRAKLKYAGFRRFLRAFGRIRPLNPNAIVAMDAATGEVRWRFEEEPWDFPACAGDEERIVERLVAKESDPSRTEHQCGPDNWGVPTIGGDGTVYAASGKTGRLYAVRDKDGNGRIDDNEVQTFGTSQGFLNAPSIAPGIMAFIPCWGPMYVFRATTASAEEGQCERRGSDDQAGKCS